MSTQESVKPSSTTPPAKGEGESAKSRYRSTLNLPQTTFPMKANLVQNEPASQKRWLQMGLYRKIREARAGSPGFLFHDGPPYANASLHLGHLLNKCLKDFVVRSRTMMGMDVPYVPGWDCHGLPIEHRVMTQLIEAGKVEKLNSLEPAQRAMAIRRECQKHAEKSIKLQAGQLQRMLTLADYDDPYLTMAPRYEAGTLEVLATLLERGLVYRAKKPVHWSIANETALAEAELEYYDREDPSVYVDFEASDAGAVYDAFGLKAETNADDAESAEGSAADVGEAKRSRAPHPGARPHQRPCFMIWTTTPWTLPANLAIAVNPRFEYALVWIDGNITVLAADAVERVTKLAQSTQVVELARTTGDRLVGLAYAHPFVDFSRAESAAATVEADPAPAEQLARCFRVVPADYVTLQDGTGLVHTAPGHGVEDYQTGQRLNLPIYCPVQHHGRYDDSVPAWLRGMLVWDANPAVVKNLKDSGHLFHSHNFTHSYPHDWRGKTPVIFRCTEQWFVGVDREFEVPGSAGDSALRERAAQATASGITFVPEWGRNRMRGMIESRPDWCISRQRAWGLPIPGFELPDGAVFMTAASCRAVAEIVQSKGSDAWFQLSAAELLANYNPAGDPHAPASLKANPVLLRDAKKGSDILDVWFESGSSWNSVLRARGLGYPADLYLEGSDQHRGWFQLSLLPALGVTGRPPFKTLLTHGFLVDKDGRKLSKSRPDAARYEIDSLTNEFGVDVMRWWVSSLAYDNDVKIDLEFFALAGESYRKVRNTLRFLLSNLSDFETPAGEKGCECARACVPVASMSPISLEAWVLGEFDTLASTVVSAYERYDFQTAQKAIYDFCNDTLSATYLAAVKDRLYCDKPDSPRRRATQTALFDLADGLCRLLAPVMTHTADEAFRALWKCSPEDQRCVHLEQFPKPSGVRVSEDWPKVLDAIKAAQVALEQAKSALGVENPLDAGVILPDPQGRLQAFNPVDLCDLLGVSQVRIDAAAPAPSVLDLRPSFPRCERSWKRDGTVRQRGDGGMLSDRDAQAVGLA